MKVLFITANDPRGTTHRLAKLLRVEGVAQTRVAQLEEPTSPQVRTDVARIHDGGAELLTLVREADILQLVDVLPDDIPLLASTPHTSNIVSQWTRETTHHESQQLDRLLGRGACAMATVPRLLGDQYMPFLAPLIAAWRPPWCPQLPGARQRARGGRTRIFASALRSIDDVPGLEPLVERAEELTQALPDSVVEVLENRPPLLTAQRQRSAQVVLSATERGLPHCALEALAQGIPTVVESQAPYFEDYARLAGGILPPVYGPQELEDLVAESLPMADPDLAIATWAQCVLDPRRWLALCSRTYATLMSAPRARRAA